MKLDNSEKQALIEIKSMIKLFCEFTKEMWELRNFQLYEVTEGPLKFKKLQSMKEIERLYSKTEQMICNDRVIFYFTIKERENHTMMQLKSYFINDKQKKTRIIADAKAFENNTGKRINTSKRFRTKRESSGNTEKREKETQVHEKKRI